MTGTPGPSPAAARTPDGEAPATGGARGEPRGNACSAALHDPEEPEFRAGRFLEHLRSTVGNQDETCLPYHFPRRGRDLAGDRVAAITLLAEALRALRYGGKELKPHQLAEAATETWTKQAPRAPLPVPRGRDLRAWLEALRVAGVPPELTYAGLAVAGEELPTPTRTVTFYLLASELGTDAREAHFHAAFVRRPGRPAAAVADPLRMLLTDVDGEFKQAVRLAHEVVVNAGFLGEDVDVLWFVTVDGIEGRLSLRESSVGLAAQLAMSIDSKRRPHAGWIPSGRALGSAGQPSDAAGRPPDDAEPEPLVDKLRKARRGPQRAALVVPSADKAWLEHKVGHGLADVVAVSDLNELIDVTSRPRAGSSWLLPLNSDVERLATPARALSTLMSLADVRGGGAAIVVGPQGAGKSSLLDKFEAELQCRQWVVAQHVCDGQRPMQRAFGPFDDILGQLQAMLRPDQPQLADRFDELRQALRPSPLPQQGPRPFRLRRGSIGQRTFHRVATALTEAARERALAIVVDDLHWADESSAALFLHLTRHLPAEAAIVLVGGLAQKRGDGPLRGSRLSVTLDQLRHECGGVVVDLETLDHEDARRIVLDTLQTAGCTDPDEELVSLLHNKCHGNIFAIKLLLNWLSERGFLRRDRGRWGIAGTDCPVAETGDIIDWFFDGLALDTQEALQYAAVIGRSFESQTLHTALGTRFTRDELISRLGESEFVRRTVGPEAGDAQWPTYEFVHSRVAKRIRDRLHDDHRRSLHRSVANAYEKRVAARGRCDEVCHLLALHCEKAGDVHRAAVHWAHLVALDRQVGAYDAALRHVGQQISCLERHAPSERFDWGDHQVQLAEAHLEAGAMHRLRGRGGDLADADAALGRARAVLVTMLEGLLGASRLPSERIVEELGLALGCRWLLTQARVEAEVGEIARLSADLSTAHARLEAAMDWGERLRTHAPEEVRADAARVIARAGCSLISLYMTRAMWYLKYAPGDEDARRAQETRVMYLCTRLLALRWLLPEQESIELRVRILRTQGNVFLWLEQNRALALDYYDRAIDVLGGRSQIGDQAKSGAHVGEVDLDVYNVLALLHLGAQDLLQARRCVGIYRAWADDVGSTEHRAAAAYTVALIEVIGATAHGEEGDLKYAADELAIALGAPFGAYPEQRLRVTLLECFLASMPDGPSGVGVSQLNPDEFPSISVEPWPSDVLGDPQGWFFCEVLSDARWWVEQQVASRSPEQKLPLVLLAGLNRSREQHLPDVSGLTNDGRRLDREMRTRVKARVSREHFEERVQAVAVEVTDLCAVHFPGDNRVLDALRCASWVHDCLWEATSEQLERLAEDWRVEAEDALEQAYPWWMHGRLGVRLVEEELELREEIASLLRSAVEWHTWPPPEMAETDALFYVACSIVDLRREEAFLSRRCDTVRCEAVGRHRLEVEQLARAPGSLFKAATSALRWRLERRQREGGAVHPRSLEAIVRGIGPPDGAL